MAHKVVVCGFGSCEKQAALVAQDLSAYYDEDVAALSFRQANADPDLLDRMTKKAVVLTHSAGMTAIKGTKPREIHAIAPPLPTFAPTLAKRVLASGRALLTTPCESEQQHGQIIECGSNFAVELAKHPRANMGKIGLIATFNAIESGIAAQDASIDVGLAFMDRDRIFQPGEAHLAAARAAGLSVVTLEGGHEKFAYQPAELMAEYEARRSLAA